MLSGLDNDVLPVTLSAKQLSPGILHSAWPDPACLPVA